MDQNLLSVGQLVENGFEVLFKNKLCLISDAHGQLLFKVKMKNRCFSLV